MQSTINDMIETKKKNSGLMTSGNIYLKILAFSIPLLLGNLFQLMYNTIGSVVVGKYVGSEALAAVGSASPVINLVIGFFMGLAVGAGVVVSRYYGARRIEEERTAIHTFLAFSFLFGIVLSVLSLFLASYILQWIGVPEDVFPSADVYLSIYFAGTVFVTVYNAGTGILQAVGDARSPLIFLGISSILNVFLDLLFVREFGLGVAGVAYATVICQAVAALLVIMTLKCTKQEYRISFKQMRINMPILIQMIRIGVPSGIQNMIVSFSNVIVQADVNSFGSAAMAGFSSANKFDNFVGMPINSFTLAVTTFTGQNLGAKRFDRVKKGVHAGLIMSIAVVLCMGFIVYTNAETCISFFTADSAVIANGSTLLRIMCPFYIFLCFHQIYSGALRASGRSNIPMVTSIMAFVVIRQIYLYFAMKYINDISVVGWGYSFTWILAAAFTSLYYFGSHWLSREEQKSAASING